MNKDMILSTFITQSVARKPKFFIHKKFTTPKMKPAVKLCTVKIS